MSEAGALILFFGLAAVVLEWRGTLQVNVAGYSIGGTAGFVMIVLGAIMLSLG